MPRDTSKETALALVEQRMPAAPLMKVNDLRGWLAKLREVANVLTPVAQFDSIPAMHAVSLRAVLVDSTVDDKGNGPDCYYTGKFMKQNERALGKRALDMIDAAAGVRTISRYRLDDRSEPWYCEIEVTKGMREVDGTWQQKTKAKAVDLRNGSAAAEALSKFPAVLQQQRTTIQELCETKAGLRVTRELLAIKQKYTTEELARPFVVPKLVPALNPEDPDEKAALIAMATGASGQLYGKRAEPALLVAEVKDVTPAGPAVQPGPKPTPPPPVRSVPEPDDEDAEDEISDAAFGDDLDFSEPAIITCLCPCGHQVEVKPEHAELSQSKIQTVRCIDCYPGKTFNYEMHKGDKVRGDGDLKIPLYPGLTAEKIREKVAAAKAAKK